MVTQKLHWYTITFQKQLPNRINNVATVYYGTETQQLTLKNIGDAANNVNIQYTTRDTIILNSMYLGYMTKEEFHKQP